MMLEPIECQAAMSFVRARIEAELHQARKPELLKDGAFGEPAGAFVTVHKAGHLRGCMGHFEADTPLGLVLARVALLAAFDDPRFPPLKPDEWSQCEIEVSVLGQLRACPDPHSIIPGRDGVLLEAGRRRALFLPQVALEQSWGLEEMLRELCMKAGLPADAWLTPDCRFQIFSADVIREQAES